MRNLKKKILIATFILLGSVTAANAQMSGPFGVKFNTSFPFVVGNAKMPAGRYTMRRLGMRESRYSLILQGPAGLVMLNTVGGSSKARFLPRSEVIFENIGGEYFLSEVRQGGEESGNRLQMSGRQRVLIAQGRPVRQIVVTSDLSEL